MTDKKFTGDMVILRGVPGSGKSTFCSLLSDILLPNHAPAVASADRFMEDAEGNYKFDFTKLETAHTRCFQAAMKSEASVLIVDNTNTQRWELSPYLALGKAQGRKVSLLKLDTALVEEAANRNIHGVPKGSVEKMHARFEKPLPFWPTQSVLYSPSLNEVRAWANSHLVTLE